MLENLFDIFGRKKKIVDIPAGGLTTGTTKETSLPPVGPRSSNPADVTLASLLLEGMVFINPDYPIEFVKVIRHLVMYNPDFSLALDNIVQLANTNYDVFFDDSVTGEEVKRLATVVNDAADNWYKYSGGMSSMKNDLLVQLVTSGALSAEMIPTNSLDGIDKVVLVDPVNIKFHYRKEQDSWLPFQYVLGKKYQLNLTQYRYVALRRISEKPYAVPPFLAALENVAIEKDMVNNIREIIRNLGVIGFMKVLIQQPPRKTAQAGGKLESDDEYTKRARSLLHDTEVEVKKGITNGYLIGFKEQHDFQMESATQNVAGAQALVQINTEMKHAGLKQSPFLLGRNYSTTETLGKVVLTILTSQVKNYQKVLDVFLQDLFKLHLTLQGFNVKRVIVESSKPLIDDEVAEQQAYGLKIDNCKKLYDQGIISQAQFALALGYSESDVENPRVQEVLVSNTAPQNEQSDKIDDFVEQYSDYPTFEYDFVEQTQVNYDIASYEKGEDKLLEKYLNEYLRATQATYKQAIGKVLNKLGQVLEKEKGLTTENLVNKVFYTLFNNWDESFNTPLAKKIKKHVDKCYKAFRKDKGIFINFDDIPDAVFNIVDLRTVEYMKTMDEVYLGKFITDPDTKKRITEFIKKTYLEEGYDLRSRASIDRFKAEFRDVLKGESWKIDQVLTTTVSRMRYQSGVNYMAQAEVTHYKRLALNDRKCCDYCKNLDGKIFSVATTFKRLSKVIAADVEDVSDFAPFVTGLYKNPNDLKNMSSEEIQKKGAELVPSHPHCRCSIIAEL
jgi:hypothetical protein